jgi:hypothetical protein
MFLYEGVTGKAGRKVTERGNLRVLERRSAPTLEPARLSRSLRKAGRLYPPVPLVVHATPTHLRT